MRRFMRAVCLAGISLAVAAGVYAGQTMLVYTGPAELVHGRSSRVTVLAFDIDSGRPLTGYPINFSVADASAVATVDQGGRAAALLTVMATPGLHDLRIDFAGDVMHAPASLTVGLAIDPQPSAIILTSDPAFPAGYAHDVTAALVDADTGAPIVAKELQFSVGSSNAIGFTDGTGFASTLLPVAPTAPLGPQSLSVTFDGDGDVLPSAANADAIVFVPSPFVIWGGNAAGVRVGDHAVFLAPDWSKQVTAGDYLAAGEFKGFVQNAVSLVEPCPGPAPCWSARAGDLRAPANASYIGVLVATGITRAQGQVVGNAERIAVIGVDAASTDMRRSGTVLHVMRPPGGEE